MARSHALVHSSILGSSLSARSIPAQLLYRQLLERRERTTLGVIIYRPATWAKTLPGTTTADVEELVAELEAHDHLIVDRDTLEVVHRTHMHHDGVLKQAQVIMAAAKARPTVESRKIGEAIDAQIPPELRDRWPDAIARGSRRQVQQWLEDTKAASYKPPKKPSTSPTTSPTGDHAEETDGHASEPTSPTEAQRKASSSPTQGYPLAQRQAPVTGDRCQVTGVDHPTAVKTPQPHAERGEPEQQPDPPDHHGQHANCRACGTNPRARGTNPRGPKPPDPAELQRRALEAEAERNAARARGQTCPTCDGTNWVDHDEGVTRCPDCETSTDERIRAAIAQEDHPA